MTMDMTTEMTTEEKKLPGYLLDAPKNGHIYGTLSYNRRSKCWTIKGEPCVTELAKRLFPGCDGRGRGVARFTAHRRIIGDLNWLMLRYPLEIKEADRARWAEALKDAREYAIRRERSLTSPASVTPPDDEFRSDLMPFQKLGVGFLLSSRRCLLADEMGLGKTVQALAFLATLRAYPALIVVPSHLLRNWQAEAARFLRFLPVALCERRRSVPTMTQKSLLHAVAAQIANGYETAEVPMYSEQLRMPDRKVIIKIIENLQKVFFPAYFAGGTVSHVSAETFAEFLLGEIYTDLREQVHLAFSNTIADESELRERTNAVCDRFLCRLPQIQTILMKDVTANFDGDPAAGSKEEVIFSYPGLYAIFVYRVAHELYESGVPLIPRIMSEYAHGATGIDINPGAQIGEYFFIDHGTGIVVGETTIIGNNVKLYQGATLGALSPAGMATNPDVRRHPKVGDNVVIYANSTLLGGATEIGDNVVIGGNAFLTSSVESDTVVSGKRAPPPADDVPRRSGGIVCPAFGR